MTIEQLLQLLQAEGYLPRLDDDGDIAFKAQGRHVFASAQENDPDFTRFFLDLYIDARETSEAVLLQAANHVQRKLKCVKAMLLRSNEEGFVVRFSVELFTDMDVLSRCATRCIDILCTAAHDVGKAVDNGKQG